MPRPSTVIHLVGTRGKLDVLAEAVTCEVSATEADPFDDAMVAAVSELARTMAGEAQALARLEATLGKLVRTARSRE